MSLSHADLLTDEKWSFDFKEIAILDAFNEIQKRTGVEIVVHQKTIQPIIVTYHNKNQSVVQVQNDLLKNINHSVFKTYSDDGGLKSIVITIIGKKERNGNMTESNSSNSPSGVTEEQKDWKANLAKPPKPPQIHDIESPPVPSPDF